MKVRVAARALAVTALTALTVGVVPPVVAPVSAAEPVDCAAFPDDPACPPVEDPCVIDPASCTGDLLVEVTMSGFGGPWSIPFAVNGSGVLSIDGIGATTESNFLTTLEDGGEYAVSYDLTGLPFQMTSFTCSTSGANDGVTYTLDYVAGTGDVTCTLALTAPGSSIDVTVVSIGGTGSFDVIADGDVDANTTVTTATSGVPHTASLVIYPGYSYSLVEDFTGPWLVTMACEDGDGIEIPFTDLVASPGEHLRCTITNSLGVSVFINKFYDGVDPAPEATEMIGTWSPDIFEVPTGLGYQTTVAHGTHTLSEIVGYYQMTAICDVVLGDDIVSTTVDNGDGSITFTAPRGATVECTLSNQPMAMVSIEKRTSGGDPAYFQFTGAFGGAGVMSRDIDDPNPADTELVPVMPGSSTISESGPGGWMLDAVECYDVNTDFPVDVFIEGDEFTLDGIEAGGEYSCVVYNVAAVSVDKTLHDVDFTFDEGVYDTTWDVTVTNPFETTMFIELVDQYFFAVGAQAGPAEVLSDEDVALNPEFDGVTDTLMAPTFALPGGETYTFHVTIPVTIEPDLEEDARLCQATFTGDNVAFTNWVSIGSDGELDSDWACGDIPAPEIIVEKDVETLVLNEDGTFTQEYVLDVTNEGDGFGTFDLYDQPGFGSVAEVLDITFEDQITDEEVVVEYTGDPVALLEDFPLGAHHGRDVLVKVRFAVNLFGSFEGADLETWRCSVDDNDVPLFGHGLYNEAFLYTTDLEPQVASGCADLPIPNVKIDKNVVGHEYLAADEIAVDFDIVVTNEIDEDHPAPLLGVYVIQDFLGLAGTSGGIFPFDFELVGVDGVGDEPEGYSQEVAPTEGMYGIGLIQPGNTHTWHVRVSYEIDTTGFNGTCPTPTAPNGDYYVTDLSEGYGGMLNGIIWADYLRYSLTFGGEGDLPFPIFGAKPSGGPRTERAVVIDTGLPFPFPLGDENGVGISIDCVDVAAISVDKTVVNDNGFDAEAGDFEFQLLHNPDDETVERTMVADTAYAVVPGDYSLTEVDDSRYTPSTFECSGEYVGPVVDGKPAAQGIDLRDEPGWIDLEVLPSTVYFCAITNDDVSVDLEAEIGHGGAIAVAGGAPITFEIGALIEEGAVAPGDDVTLTATLPGGWSWVTGTVVGCPGATIVGTLLTCVVPAATLIEDDEFTFTAQARLAAGAFSGGYTAIATVGNDGDPAEGSQTCESANSACDFIEAVREASISATKTSDAVGGSVARGATLKYTLTVTNQGPSTLLPGTQVTDDLPPGLTFVSASGAGWLCNSGDPLVCTNDTVVAPNTSLPPLVVTTKVDNAATGTIVNIGVFTGIVDQEALAEPTAFVGQRRTEAVVTTATATASAAASVTVKSGSGGRGLPATGVDGLVPTMWVSALTLSIGALALLFARRRRPARG